MLREAASAAPELGLERHVIHGALYRPVLFGGAEPAVVLVEVTTAFALVFGVGFHIATVLLALCYVTVAHGVMVWVAQQDPQMTALYVRSLGSRDFYPPHARAHAGPPPVAPAIPRGR